DTLTVAHNEHGCQDLIEERRLNYTTFSMLLISAQSLIQQVNQWDERTVQKRQPIYFVTDILQGDAGSNAARFSTREVLREELLSLFSNFVQKITAQALNLAIEALGRRIVVTDRLNHEDLVLETDPLLNNSPWKGSCANGG